METIWVSYVVGLRRWVGGHTDVQPAERETAKLTAVFTRDCGSGFWLCSRLGGCVCGFVSTLNPKTCCQNFADKFN